MINDKANMRNERIENLARRLSKSPGALEGFTNGIRRAVLEHAELVAFVRKQDRPMHLRGFIKTEARRYFTSSPPRIGSPQERILTALQSTDKYVVLDEFGKAVLTRDTAGECEIARTVLGEDWEKSPDAADDERLINRMLTAPAASLPSPEVIQRVVQDLWSGKTDFLEAFLSRRQQLDRSQSRRRSIKDKGVVSNELTVPKGARGANASRSEIFGMREFEARIIKFWTNDDLPMWLMTETAAVDALNYLAPEQLISRANYHKIVAKLQLHRLHPSPIRSLFITVDKENGTKSVAGFGFVSWLKARMKM